MAGIGVQVNMACGHGGYFVITEPKDTKEVTRLLYDTLSKQQCSVCAAGKGDTIPKDAVVDMSGQQRISTEIKAVEQAKPKVVPRHRRVTIRGGAR